MQSTSRSVGSVRIAALLILLTFSTVSASGAEIVTLMPERDATLFEDVTGTTASGSGPTLFVGDNRILVTRRALVRFDLASLIPPDAVVLSVELGLHVSDAPDETPRDVTLHRVLVDWGEGSSASSGGGGAVALAGDATWLHRFYPGRYWANPGGDFEPSSSARAMLGSAGWQSWSGCGLVQDVQGWIDDPSSNHGWLLKGEEGTASSARGLSSSENQQPELHPYLRIEYQGCCVATERTSWSRLKVGY